MSILLFLSVNEKKSHIMSKYLNTRAKARARVIVCTYFVIFIDSERYKITNVHVYTHAMYTKTKFHSHLTCLRCVYTHVCVCVCVYVRVHVCVCVCVLF